MAEPKYQPFSRYPLPWAQRPQNWHNAECDSAVGDRVARVPKKIKKSPVNNKIADKALNTLEVGNKDFKKGI